MLRRKPTRLELKMEDTEEFESVKKQLEQARKPRREEADASPSVAGGGACSDGGGASGGGVGSRSDAINERIGYKPHPKPATLPALFGNLQF